MIGRLRGTLAGREPPLLWLDVQGVGYELEAPMSTFYRLPDLGQEVTLHTHFAVRDDHHALFAFHSAAEKGLFRQLIRVSGVGPKVALVILSGVSTAEFWDTVRDGDTARLVRLPGVGKKTAERLVVELRDRAEREAGRGGDPGAAASEEDVGGLAARALVALGYRPAEARRMAEAAAGAGRSTEDIIREALRQAMK